MNVGYHDNVLDPLNELFIIKRCEKSALRPLNDQQGALVMDVGKKGGYMGFYFWQGDSIIYPDRKITITDEVTLPSL